LSVGLPLPDNSDTAYFTKVLTVMRTALSRGILKNNENVPTGSNPCDLDNAIYLVKARSVHPDARLRTPQQTAFATDLENLRGLWRTAELRYRTNLQDLTDSAGNLDNVGTTLANMHPGRDIEFC
jgi:hypothetical protein